jgi:spectrin beta
MVLHKGKDALLLWCKAYTKGYPNVAVKDFTTSWHDGLAFCALLHCFRPDLIDFEKLSPSEPRVNLETAFSAAAKVMP